MTRNTFAQQLADQFGVAAGEPVVFLKHEGEFNPTSYFATREDFVRGERRRECGWITVEAAQRLARKRRARLVEF
jgi:hypothetical protein